MISTACHHHIMLRIVGVVVTVLLIAVAVAVVLLKYSILILSDPKLSTYI